MSTNREGVLDPHHATAGTAASPRAEDDDPTGIPAGFFDFGQSAESAQRLRAAIASAYRRPEPECLPPLLQQAEQTPAAMQAVSATARKLVSALRAKRTRGLVESLLQEYALSSQEGVALMCLAEALLRIPDNATRDALIRDKIGRGNWQSHLGGSRPMFVHAATWGLLITGRLSATSSETNLSTALSRLIARGGEPVIRQGLNIAMRLMGEQFVIGRTIAEALNKSRQLEARGYRYSYDMLGEAALTADDAARYLRDYEQAIEAIGKASAGRGIYEGPGISIKLSALHPRYVRAQRRRVMTELLPRLVGLVKRAHQYDIGINIDAEEADRLELSLDLLESLCFEPSFEGWNGIGFVVQAYQKRAPFVIDYLTDLAHRSGHRIMVRLVKGAYWDSEIKRAQVDGLEDFPVYTRKVHTDVAYLACARKLLAATKAVYPQFATHNAQTLAAIHAMAGRNYYAGQYEFQCLHGMGEPLYDEVVGRNRLNRPCRIYAPVGTHETLLPYLVRRLLENGANTSFVNRIADPDVSIDALVVDPVAAAREITPVGAPHEKIAAPAAIFGDVRRNSSGIDLSNELRLTALAAAARATMQRRWRAVPMLADGDVDGAARAVCNPADLRDRVGEVVEATPATVDQACAGAQAAAARWAATPTAERAAILTRASDLLEADLQTLVGLIVREAGKSVPAAVGEVREAADFLRYYAAEVARHWADEDHRPLGVVLTISPWNFPLAIFTGQLSAALAAGNAVLAKPAEQTPLIAAAGVEILHRAGIPRGALQLIPGDGRVGGALVADRRVDGVMFTGSTEVARIIQRTLADRVDADGAPIPLIAETGGQNAMVVDSSALAEQAVTDIIGSGFDSAGQRCSALRILLLQEDVADRLIEMLHGAVRELRIGRPDRLDTDVGPVITEEARDEIQGHIRKMGERGFKVFSAELSDECARGHFVPPTLIEIPDPSVLGREVFGPVIHVVRYKRANMAAMIDKINGLGYALTFGVHSRIDETIDRAVGRIDAGNVYVNRNIIGAVVGVQPFGGHGLSGTGPKAGGPLYVRRLMSRRPAEPSLPKGHAPQVFEAFLGVLQSRKVDTAAMAAIGARTLLGVELELPGPVGERNTYRLRARGAVLCVASDTDGALRQIAAALATGNRAVVDCVADLSLLDDVPEALQGFIARARADGSDRYFAALFSGDADAQRKLASRLAARDGIVVPIHAAMHRHDAGAEYPLEYLLAEQAISVNTAAAGGNASLMTIG